MASWRRLNGERGASLVEMALVAPFLLLILLGIIEFGYTFGEFNEVRHAAREGARFAAVSNVALDTDADADLDAIDVKNAVCDTLNLAAGTVDVAFTRSGSAIGNEATVQVTANGGSLTNAPIISMFIPNSLSNTATFRLEQVPTWTATSFTNAC
jgi:Flp pilus assembly protein TadG